LIVPVIGVEATGSELPAPEEPHPLRRRKRTAKALEVFIEEGYHGRPASGQESSDGAAVISDADGPPARRRHHFSVG
jgi:hypothetical protein